MLTPPVQSAPRHVARSRGHWFSQAHHLASRQSQQLGADFSSSATGPLGTSVFEKWDLVAANGDQSPERIQEKEGRV